MDDGWWTRHNLSCLETSTQPQSHSISLAYPGASAIHDNNFLFAAHLSVTSKGHGTGPPHLRFCASAGAWSLGVKGRRTQIDSTWGASNVSAWSRMRSLHSNVRSVAEDYCEILVFESNRLEMIRATRRKKLWKTWAPVPNSPMFKGVMILFFFFWYPSCKSRSSNLCCFVTKSWHKITEASHTLWPSFQSYSEAKIELFCVAETISVDSMLYPTMKQVLQCVGNACEIWIWIRRSTPVASAEEVGPNVAIQTEGAEGMSSEVNILQ